MYATEEVLNAAETYFVVQLKDSNSKYSQLCKIANGGVVATQGENVGTTLENNIWYNIAVAYDYADRLYSIYIDGELVKDDIAIEANFGDASIASLLRFYCPSLKDILGTEVFDVSDHNAEFLIDNVRVYKGTKPCAELVESEVEIQINPEKMRLLA